MPQGNKLMAGLVALRALPDGDAIFRFSRSLLASLDGVNEVSIERGDNETSQGALLTPHEALETIAIPVVYKNRTFATISLSLATENGTPLLSAISNFANLVALELSHREKNDELSALLQQQNQVNSKLSAMTLFAAKASGIGVWEFELETQTLIWNDQMLEIFGLTSGDVKDTFEDWAESLHPDDADTAKAELQQCIETNQPFESQFRILRPSGEVRHLTARAEFYTDETSGKRFLIGTNIDVTETKNLELQLQHAQRLEAVGKLTGGIAHDFNNLLQIISGSVQLTNVILQKSEINDASLTHHLDTAMSAIDSASSLTSRLLAFSRRDALNPSNTSLTTLLNDAVIILRRTLGEDITLDIDIPADLPALFIDKHQLENALLNLSINARDAMPDGGQLQIKASHPAGEHLLIAGEKIEGRNYVLISIKDSGEGMTPEVLEQVFDPFFTTKEVGKGSGLGLSMVHGFVNQSGGHITLNSKPGLGTMVRLYLPIAEGEPAEEPVASASGKRSESYRILLVEDEPAVSDVARGMLENKSHQVVAVPTAQQALEELKKDGAGFDLLLTDMALPGGMNGLELAEEVKRRWPGIKILFSSGYVDRFAEHASDLITGKNFLKKPYKQTDLLELVDRAMTASDDTAADSASAVFGEGK